MPKTPTGKPDLVAIAWYSEENFDRIRALVKDGGGLQPTYQEWLRQAQSFIASLIVQGITVERVEMDPDNFTAWLRSENVDSNEQTRARYAFDIASAKYGKNH